MLPLLTHKSQPDSFRISHHCLLKGLSSQPLVYSLYFNLFSVKSHLKPLFPSAVIVMLSAAIVSECCYCYFQFPLVTISILNQ